MAVALIRRAERESPPVEPQPRATSRPPATSVAALPLLALAAWTLFAFAGAYRWTFVPALLGTALLAVLRPPALLAPRTRILDAALLAALAAVSLQLVPLPAIVRNLLSPGAARLEATLHFGPRSTFATLSIDPSSTWWSLAVAVTVAAVFWLARAQFEQGGLRQVCRGFAWIGLALAIVVFVQRFTSPHLIYGLFAPAAHTSNPSPFGPYVNRNDLATWLLLAVPLVLGYAIGRTIVIVRGRRWSSVIDRIVDPRMVLLLGSTTLMAAALVSSLSRSGIIGLTASLAILAATGRRRLGTTGAHALAIALMVFLVLALPFVNIGAMAFRFGDALPGDIGERVNIWSDAWTMAHDFPLAGLGAGAFAHGMLVYQHAPRTLFFNHAHNEYLQVLTEGGLLLALPLALACVATLLTAVRHLRRDVVAVFWFRLGALAGLIAVAIQNAWDTGLRMPANAVLFAIVAAIAVHKSPHGTGGNED